MEEGFRGPIVRARLEDYYGTLRTTLFAFVGLAAIISFAPDGSPVMIVPLVIAVSAFGILAGNAALDDVEALREDMDDEMAGSAFGKMVSARNMTALKATSSGLVGLTGLAQLWAVFA